MFPRVHCGAPPFVRCVALLWIYARNIPWIRKIHTEKKDLGKNRTHFSSCKQLAFFQFFCFFTWYDFLQSTPPKTNMEPENYPLEQENHLPSSSIFGFQPLVFRGVRKTCGGGGGGLLCGMASPVPAPKIALQCHWRNCWPSPAAADNPTGLNGT